MCYEIENMVLYVYKAHLKSLLYCTLLIKYFPYLLFFFYFIIIILVIIYPKFLTFFIYLKLIL